MMMPQWSDEYLVDNQAIDDQHKELFRLANFVYRLDPAVTTKKEIAALFKSFFSYIGTHFRDEEQYMESIGYPLLSEHRKLHEDIIEDLTHIIKSKRHLFEIRESIKYIAKRWLVEHILMHDMKFKMWREGSQEYFMYG